MKPSLRCLTISRLEEFEDLLYDELEPVDICDVLFEESAVDIPSHDKITDPTRRRKQTECLLKTVKENKHDCFHFFLYIVQEIFPFVCQELEERIPSPIEVGMYAFIFINHFARFCYLHIHVQKKDNQSPIFFKSFEYSFFFCFPYLITFNDIYFKITGAYRINLTTTH